ncbi:MAG: hypothetical protein CBB71_09330 [Rhodopirellula sp. TMED11]|nr:MAG: hypothetical protein CBB71_09330 [Rhodopirellula sp. TMED11]
MLADGVFGATGKSCNAPPAEAVVGVGKPSDWVAVGAEGVPAVDFSVNMAPLGVAGNATLLADETCGADGFAAAIIPVVVDLVSPVGTPNVADAGLPGRLNPPEAIPVVDPFPSRLLADDGS